MLVVSVDVVLVFVVVVPDFVVALPGMRVRIPTGRDTNGLGTLSAGSRAVLDIRVRKAPRSAVSAGASSGDSAADGRASKVATDPPVSME